jgi:hypothetical protein
MSRGTWTVGGGQIRVMHLSNFRVTNKMQGLGNRGRDVGAEGLSGRHIRSCTSKVGTVGPASRLSLACFFTLCRPLNSDMFQTRPSKIVFNGLNGLC